METPGDRDESDPFFNEATAIAAENNDTLDADKERSDGFKTVKLDTRDRNSPSAPYAELTSPEEAA